MIPDRTHWGLIALTFAIGLFAALQFGKVSLTLVEFSAHYTRPIPVMAGLVSLVGVIGIVFGVMAGGWIARFGPRQVIIWATGLGAALSLVQMALPPLPILFALRGLEGISHLALVVAAPPLMAGFATDRDRPVVMAIWAMFFGVAFAMAAQIIPWIIGAGGLPLLFGLHGVGLLVCMGLFARWVPARFGPPSPTAQMGYVAQHWMIYTHVHLCAPALGFFFYAFLFVATVTFLPMALSLPYLGTTLPLVSLAGTLWAGRLAQSMNAATISMTGFASMALCAVGVTIGVEWAVYPLFLAMGMVPGAQFALIPALNTTTADQTRATGAIAQMGNMGTVNGTPFFALILQGLGPLTVTLAIAVIGLCGAAVVWALQRQTRLSGDVAQPGK
ncbi:MAG: MFS transporter [Pseudomonadota bacterium]